MKNQKELKEMYMEVIKNEVWKNSQEMQKYAKKECAYIVELSNGNIISLDKPKIEKNFCFGMGMYGTYTDEECQSASRMVEIAETNQDYFIKENLKQLTEKIECLQECITGGSECYTFISYYNQPEKSILKGYRVTGLFYNPEYEPGLWSNLKDLKKLDTADIQRIIDGLEEVKNAFVKRLNTYLKRYGLSKVNAWTYCRD